MIQQEFPSIVLSLLWGCFRFTINSVLCWGFQDVDQGCLWDSKGTQHTLALGLDKFCRQNFGQNKWLMRRAFCRQNRAFSSRIWAEWGKVSGANYLHNSCKKNLKLNKKQMENTLWLIRLLNSYNAFTLKWDELQYLISFKGLGPGSLLYLRK